MSGLVQSDEELRQIVQTYMDDVLARRRVVGRLERLAVQRQVRDLEAVRKGKRKDWRFDESQALAPLQFATRFVRHTKGKWAGQKYAFCSRSAWIAFVLWCLFGWYARQEDGTWQRRFDEALVSTARKQGKSMVAAIVALFMYLAMGEAAPEVYFGATQRDQAAIAWKQAAGIVRKDPSLSKRLKISKSAFLISKESDFEAVFKPLSRNDDEFDGLFPFCVVLDEVHAHPDSGMYDVLRSGMQARQSPLRLLITTRGANPEGFYAQHEKTMVDVLEQVYDEDATFIFIACLDEKDDWKDEKTWPKANPNIGLTVTVDKIRQELKRALNDPGKLPEFLRKYMNLWAVGAKGWLPLTKWDACKAPFDPEELRGQVAAAAVDLSKSNDFTAAALVFPRPGGEYWALAHFWLPEAALEERRARSKVPFDTWIRQGLITVTPGEIVDQDFVKEWLEEQRKLYRLKEIAFDPAQSWKLCGELQALGVEGVLHFPQKWALMHAALKETEDAILLKKLRHGGNRVLRWMFRNVAIRENSTGLRRLDKEKSADKIDGIVALVMALARAQLLIKTPSVYERRGVITL